jgi:hypothetical protein
MHTFTSWQAKVKELQKRIRDAKKELTEEAVEWQERVNP